MIQLCKAFLHDGLSWLLLLLLIIFVLFGFTTLFHRYEQVDSYKRLLNQIEYDIDFLQKEKNQKLEWSARLKEDPTAWEQVARDKMNYLGPNEVLITFVPAP
jgi:hypothetical protein